MPCHPAMETAIRTQAAPHQGPQEPRRPAPLRVHDLAHLPQTAREAITCALFAASPWSGDEGAEDEVREGRWADLAARCVGTAVGDAAGSRWPDGTWTRAECDAATAGLRAWWDPSRDA